VSAGRVVFAAGEFAEAGPGAALRSGAAA